MIHATESFIINHHESYITQMRHGAEIFTIIYPKNGHLGRR